MKIDPSIEAMTLPEETDLRLNKMTHDLFSRAAYSNWIDGLGTQSKERWYSLIAELSKSGCNYEVLHEFDENIRLKLVYRLIPAADFRKSGKLFILFSWADGIWNSVIIHRPGVS